MTTFAEARVFADLHMDVFRAAVDFVVHEKIVSSSNSRTKHIDDEGRAVLATSDDVLRGAALQIVSAIEECVDVSSTYRSLVRRRAHAEMAFRRVRFTSLSLIWGSLYGILHMEMSDQIFPQSVNDKIFESLLSAKMLAIGKSSLEELPDCQYHLSSDELNALRYAAGFIPFKLLKRYNQGAAEGKRQVIACLEECEKETRKMKSMIRRRNGLCKLIEVPSSELTKLLFLSSSLSRALWGDIWQPI